MELSRRRLFTLGAATAATAGTGVLATAPVAQASSNASAGPSRVRRAWETDYDHRAKQQNLANQLGCPLGRGD